MIFHENRLLADDSYVISCLIFFENWEKDVAKFVIAAVVIDALKVIFAAYVKSRKHFQDKNNIGGIRVWGLLHTYMLSAMNGVHRLWH